MSPPREAVLARQSSGLGLCVVTQVRNSPIGRQFRECLPLLVRLDSSKSRGEIGGDVELGSLRVQ
eukprot:m.81558 g.81558  ORF g.81558 m.81558 type:complete len:65 (+) comp11011_c0_seq1:59-253(+)